MTPDVPAPETGFLVALFLTVRDVDRSRDWYAHVFEAVVVRERDPAMLRIANSWLILNPGGGPTPDKPDILLAPPVAGAPVSSFMNLRVADVAAAYDSWRSRGAEFLTPPIAKQGEIRCYIRDPDGYLIEVGQST